MTVNFDTRISSYYDRTFNTEAKELRCRWRVTPPNLTPVSPGNYRDAGTKTNTSRRCGNGMTWERVACERTCKELRKHGCNRTRTTTTSTVVCHTPLRKVYNLGGTPTRVPREKDNWEWKCFTHGIIGSLLINTTLRMGIYQTDIMWLGVHEKGANLKWRIFDMKRKIFDRRTGHVKNGTREKHQTLLLLPH